MVLYLLGQQSIMAIPFVQHILVTFLQRANMLLVLFCQRVLVVRGNHTLVLVRQQPNVLFALGHHPLMMLLVFVQHLLVILRQQTNVFLVLSYYACVLLH